MKEALGERESDLLADDDKQGHNAHDGDDDLAKSQFGNSLGV